MLKGNLILILIIGAAFVFTTNTFGQNNKRKQTKPKTPPKGVSEWTDVLAKNSSKRKPSQQK